MVLIAGKGKIYRFCLRCFPAFPDDTEITDAKPVTVSSASSVKVSSTGVDEYPGLNSGSDNRKFSASAVHVREVADFSGIEVLSSVGTVVELKRCMTTLIRKITIPQFML